MKPLLTDKELDAVSAWWLTGSLVEAAKLLGISRNTIKNQLYVARIRASAPTNVILVQKHLKVLRSMEQLEASHNVHRVAAA